MESSEKEILIPKAEADKLISAHDGDMALLFLYSYLHRGIDREDAARDLCRTMSEITAAEEKLSRLGLTGNWTEASDAVENQIVAADNSTEDPIVEIESESEDDAEFCAIVSETQKALGHTLSTKELQTLIGIHDNLALSAEVIMVLLNHCVSTSDGHTPTINYIQKEALQWAKLEILTAEQAEKYISSTQTQSETVSNFARTVGITGRELTSTEQKYLNSWVEMGFDNEALSIAYERTISNIGSMRWTYIHKILLSWHKAGIHTGAEVSEKDPRQKRGTSNMGKKSEPQKIDLEEFKKLTENF